MTEPSQGIGRLLCRLGFHSYDVAREESPYQYLECRRCTRRKIIKLLPGGDPYDATWLRDR